MRHLLIIVCSIASLMASASNDYPAKIALQEQDTAAMLRPTAAKIATRYYSRWAQDSVAAGQYTPAVQIYQSALQDTFLLPDNHTVIAVNLAKLYNNHLLMPRSAWELLQQYRFSASYPTSWQWDLALAQTLTSLKQQDEALAIYDSLVATLHEPPFDLYASRGFLHLAMRHHAQAVQDLSRAMRHASDSMMYYRIASNIAFAKAETEDCEGALQDISACLNYAQRIGHETDITIYHRKRAQIHLLCGDTTAAVQDYKTYWTREKQFIIDHFASMTQQQRLDYWANRKPLISGIFRLEGHDPAFLADVSVFRHQAALLGVHDTTPDILRTRLDVDAKAVQRCLRQDEAAIEFIKYYNRDAWHYAAVVLTADKATFVPVCTADQLPTEAICSASEEDKNWLYTDPTIAALIWDPLYPYLQDKKDIWFAPDGILNMLAIEYLPFPVHPTPYTVHSTPYTIHRLTSIGLLTQRTKKQKRCNRQALLIGGLDYEHMDSVQTPSSSANQNGLRYWVATRKRLAHFSYLPGTRKEVDSISHSITRWVKTYAESEEQLKEEFGRFQLVHLSTHGYSLEVLVSPPDERTADSVTLDRSLLASGLALSGANISYRHPDREDGLLTSREICELDLRHVELVVASACQSAQGKISDEGPAGILRSLKLAGVKCVMATLWPVHDEATTLFMHFFYEAWQNGKRATKQQALLYAQQQLRQYGLQTPRKTHKFNPAKLSGQYTSTRSAIFNEPFFWAPFILVDDLETDRSL